MGVKPTNVSMGIQITTMAIREVLMTYFKGSCGETMVQRSKVSVESDRRPTRYHYQRDAEALVDRRAVWLGDAKIMHLEKDPDKVILYEKVLTRSPQFRVINEQIHEFFKTHLGGVKVEVNHGDVK